MSEFSDSETQGRVFYYEDRRGNFGGSTPTLEYIDDLISDISSRIRIRKGGYKYPSFYEELGFGTRIKPYFDCESTAFDPNDKELKQKVNLLLNTSIGAICEYYDCEPEDIACFDASGHTGSNKFKVSFHFVVNYDLAVKAVNLKNVASKLNGIVNERMKIKDLNPFDLAVYKKIGSSQKFRLPYCVKYGDTRVLKLIDGVTSENLELMSINFENTLDWKPEFKNEYWKWFAQIPTSAVRIEENLEYVDGDHIAFELIEKYLDEDDTIGDYGYFSDDESDEITEDTSLVIGNELFTLSPKLENIKKMLMAIDIKHATERDDWRNTIFALKSYACENPDENPEHVRLLAHMFSKRCPDKYNEREVDRIFDRSDSKGITIRTVYNWLHKEDPDLHAEISEKVERMTWSDFENALTGDNKYIPEEFKDIEFKQFNDYTILRNIKRDGKSVPLALAAKYLRQTFVVIKQSGKPILQVRDFIEDDRFNLFHDYTFSNSRDMESVMKALKHNYRIENPLFNPMKKKSKENNPYFIDGKLSSLLNYMYEESYLEEQNRLTFIPYFKEPPKFETLFNTFLGFPVQRVIAEQKNSVTSKLFKESKIFNHIRNELCAGEEHVFDYVMKWIADIIQDPVNRPGVNILIHGPQGNGKNLFADFISLVIGKNYTHAYNDIERFLQKHNTDHLGKLFIVLNELTDRGKDVRFHNVLKDMTDCKQVRVEPKFQEAFNAPMFSRLLLLTNNEHSIHIEATDRRYCMIKSKGTYANNREYFGGLINEAFTSEMIMSAFVYFSELDVSKFKETPAPKTQFHFEQKQAAMNPIIKFMIDLFTKQTSIRDPTCGSAFENNKDGIFYKLRFRQSDLYDSYKQWCSDANEKAQSKIKFWQFIDENKLLPEPTDYRFTSNDGRRKRIRNFYQVEVDEFERNIKNHLKDDRFSLGETTAEDEDSDSDSDSDDDGETYFNWQ